MHQSRWEIREGDGPIIATAIHAGHMVREELAPNLALQNYERRREEDSLTELWASVGDHVFVNNISRFEVDLNRSREQAVYRRPEDAWGLEVWSSPPSDEAVQNSLRIHQEFYSLMKDWIETLINKHGKILLLDVHSYNFRRKFCPQKPISEKETPDIDLGLTTADPKIFKTVINNFKNALSNKKAGGRLLDVRENIRYPDGGHWPEWVYANYGKKVCTITLEYKKIYMDEWSGKADLAIVEDLRVGLKEAVTAAKKVL